MGSASRAGTWREIVGSGVPTSGGRAHPEGGQVVEALVQPGAQARAAQAGGSSGGEAPRGTRQGAAPRGTGARTSREARVTGEDGMERSSARAPRDARADMGSGRDPVHA